MNHNSSKKPRPREPLNLRYWREIARLLAVLAAAPVHQAKPAGRLSRALDWASGHFNLLASAAVLLVFLGAWVRFDVSPLLPLEKINHEQIDYRLQKDKQKFIECVAGRHLKMGCDFLNDGQYEKAREEFTEALKLNPNDLRAELGKLKSNIYDFGKGEYNHKLVEQRVKEIEAESKKLKKDPKAPDDPHVLIFWGDFYAREGNTDEAIECFRKALKIDERIAEAYFKLGFLYGKKSEHALVVNDERSGKALKALALENYKKAVEISSWDTRYLNNLAYQYAQMKDHKNAIDNYKKAIHVAPDFVLPYLELSDVFHQIGELTDAYVCLREAVILLEDQRVAPKNRGGWLFRCDRVPYKVKLYEIPEKQAYAYLSMALTLHLLDRKPEALSYLEKARRLDIKTMPVVLSVVRQDHARLPDQSKNKSGFLAILKGEISTSE